MKKIVSVLVAFSVLATAAASVSVDTSEFVLSIKHDGVRASAGNEPLAYSPFWGEVTNGTVRLTQTKDGGAEASEIVSGLVDEGTNLWKATQNGTYVLTHEVVTNGVVAETLSATFSVMCGGDLDQEGIEARLMPAVFKYDGTPKTPSVVVTFCGVKLRENVDYRVSFADNVEIGNAVAIISGIGDYSGEIRKTFVIYGDMGARNLKFKQRYPWNGKADLDMQVTGDPDETYILSLAANDLEGGTNLPLRTVWADFGIYAARPDLKPAGADLLRGVTNSVFAVTPGDYRFVWDADADIENDIDFKRVSLRIDMIDGDGESMNLRLASEPTLAAGVDLTWDACDGCDGYNVYRRIGDEEEKLATVAAPGYNDKLPLYKLPLYTDARYCVRAVFNGVEVMSSKSLGVRASIPSGAVVYLPLDGEEIYDVADENPNKLRNLGNGYPYFHRENSDNPWDWRAGRKGTDSKCLYINDSNSRVCFPTPEKFGVTNSFTVAFWCKPDASLSTIVAEKNSGNYGVIEAKYPFLLAPAHGGDGGEAGVGVAVGINGIAVVEHAGCWFPATLVYSAGIGSRWVHIAFTIENNGAAKLYVDGAWVRTGVASTKIKKIVDSMIGQFEYGQYYGCIEDFFIFDRALSSEEIAAVYQTTTSPIVAVQLWENGPYWAECNVGASAPEEYGYYFWWGDTVGYKRNSGNDGWVSVADGSAFSFSGENCPTYGKEMSALLSGGYIDSAGNLAPAYDAASVHLGGDWRLPTHDEFGALIDNCTTTWTTLNGVYGRLVTGKGDYVTRSIFLPAAGNGYGSDRTNAGSNGFYWSSTPNTDDSNLAWNLSLGSSEINRYSGTKGRGSARTVRSVRDSEK